MSVPTLAISKGTTGEIFACYAAPSNVSRLRVRGSSTILRFSLSFCLFLRKLFSGRFNRSINLFESIDRSFLSLPFFRDSSFVATIEDKFVFNVSICLPIRRLRFDDKISFNVVKYEYRAYIRFIRELEFVRCKLFKIICFQTRP